MTNDKFATDHLLSSTQQKCLSALLDTIMPAAEDGSMPSAGKMDFLGFILAQAENFMPALVQILDQLDEKFANDPLAARVARLEDFARADKKAFNRLLVRVYDCYYQDDQVRVLIGIKPSPPFPQGNTVEPGDLSLLDAVVERGQGYRR